MSINIPTTDGILIASRLEQSDPVWGVSAVYYFIKGKVAIRVETGMIARLSGVIGVFHESEYNLPIGTQYVEFKTVSTNNTSTDLKIASLILENPIATDIGSFNRYCSTLNTLGMIPYKSNKAMCMIFTPHIAKVLGKKEHYVD